MQRDTTDNWTPGEAVDRALELFLAMIQEDEALRAEFAASTGEFFPSGIPDGSVHETLLAGRRHLEWFVLERHSPSLFGTPVERLLDAWRRRAEPAVAAVEDALLSSFTGVFEVSQVAAGEGAWLRDLAGLGEHPIVAPAGSAYLQAGDLIVGRVFPMPGGANHLSRAVAMMREAALVGAVERDLAHTRERQAGKVLHVAQRELERMFFSGGSMAFAAATGVAVDPVGEARRWLAEAGLGEARIAGYLDTLQKSPCDPARLVHGAGDALAAILDDLAFETDIDLDRTRLLLMDAWRALAAPSVPASRPATADARGARDARAAVEAFARGRRAGRDLDTLLSDLARDLGIEEDDDETDDGSTLPDFPGVVGAMIEEFLWETAHDHGQATAERFAVLRNLGRFGENIGLFEALGPRDLLHFSAFWLHETSAVATPEEARDLVDALATFCEWAESAHEVPLATGFAEPLHGLRESLPRIVDANARLRTAPAAPTGRLFELVTLEGNSARLRDLDGHELRARLAHELAARLQPGDRLRASEADDGALDVLRCYPPEAAGLTSP